LNQSLSQSSATGTASGSSEGFFLRAFNWLLPFAVIVFAILGRQVFSGDRSPSRKQR